MPESLLASLLLVLIGFFALRASRNLVRALRGDYEETRQVGNAAREDRSQKRWERSSSTSSSSRSRGQPEYDYGEPDIEDAKWEDL